MEGVKATISKSQRDKIEIGAKTNTYAHDRVVCIGQGAETTESESIVIKAGEGAKLEIRKDGTTRINGKKLDVASAESQIEIATIVTEAIKWLFITHSDQLAIENFLRDNSTDSLITGGTVKYKLNGKWYDYRGPSGSEDNK